MTTGQIMFYGGIGLVALAFLLLIVFMIRKPKYVPENAVYDTSVNKTVRDQHVGQYTSAVTVQSVENVSNADRPVSQETAALLESSEETVPLMEVLEETPETVPLMEVLEETPETVPLAQETEVLEETFETVPLA